MTRAEHDAVLSIAFGLLVGFLPLILYVAGALIRRHLPWPASTSSNRRGS